MFQSQQEEENKPVERKTYGYTDLLQFQTLEPYTSIGKMKLSTKPTAPSYGFGTSNRTKTAKVYQDEALSRTQFIGKTSPGPYLDVRHMDKYTYKQDPQWSIGKEIRNTLNTGAKHAYYTRQDVDFDPITADNYRKWGNGSVKIGLESRFVDGPKRYKATPGPDYNPSLKPEIPNQPKFSFGVRREIKGASPLVLMASTPEQVGPGSYYRDDQGNTSTMPDHPKVGFTKNSRFGRFGPNIQKNQTYDTRSSIGCQVASRNRTMSAISVGNAKRDNRSGIFKDMMSTQPTRVRIHHAKY